MQDHTDTISRQDTRRKTEAWVLYGEAETVRIAHPSTSSERTHLSLPLASCPVTAGFPSPADDFAEDSLDLNEYLIKHPAATFFVRVAGMSMKDAGILPGDLLIVDRAAEAGDGAIVIAVLDGEFTLKRLRKRGEKVQLQPENQSYRSIEVTGETNFQVWGVVTHVIHKT
jgi:DNA polymerase V